jgi:uncharacterized protein (DUF488 family)
MSIFTIGYGGRKFADFVAHLQQHGIALVVDVRRFPRSKAPEYKKESLEAKLPPFGISYIWMGDTLGGFRRGGYPKYMETDDYRDGISKLLELAEQGTLVLMCKERTDAGCHRRYIAETLAGKGLKTTPLK